jgi:hypothetical protein
MRLGCSVDSTRALSWQGRFSERGEMKGLVQYPESNIFGVGSKFSEAFSICPQTESSLQDYQ